MKESIELRQPTLVDFKEELYPQLLALDSKAFPPEDFWTEEVYKEFLKAEQARIRMIWDGDNLVGYFFTMICEVELPDESKVRTGYVASIAVEEKYQGQGIGECLLREAVSELWEVGAPRVILHTRLSNIKSQNLSRKLGFKKIGVVSGVYKNEEAILMQLEK